MVTTAHSVPAEVQASTGKIVKRAEKQSKREGLTEDERRLRDFQRSRTAASSSVS